MTSVSLVEVCSWGLAPGQLDVLEPYGMTRGMDPRGVGGIHRGEPRAFESSISGLLIMLCSQQY